MAIGDAYATAAEYLARVKKTDTGDNTEIDLDLMSVSRMLDRQLGMTKTGFNVDASDVTRIYLPDSLAPDRRSLVIDPLVSLTSVTIDTDQDGDFTDETALDVTQRTGDILLYPTDAVDGPEPQPYTELRTSKWGAYANGWPAGLEVQVVGTWGWPTAVPDAIKTATIQLCGILRLETPRATNTVSEIGDVTTMSGDAQRIIRDLRSVYRSAAVGSLF